MTDLPPSPSPTPPDAVKIPAFPLHFKGCPASPLSKTTDAACTCNLKSATPGSVSGEERRRHLNALTDNVSRITVGELPGYGIAIYDKGADVTERVIVKNHIEAEQVARALADRFGTGRFRVIRQRNSEGRFEP